VEQVLSQKMGELSSQERAEIEIEAGFPGDFISANNNEDPKENGHGNGNFYFDSFIKFDPRC